MRGLLGAVSLLTRVPTGGRGDPTAAAAWLPVVGGGIGVVVGAAHAGLHLGLPPLLAALVAVSLGIVLTGALHEDGLADCADAIGARGDRSDVLAVLHDPRLGTFGVLALVVSVGVRASALSSFAGWAAVWTMVAAHALGRSAAVAVMLIGRPSGDGLGTLHAPSRRAWVGVASGIALGAAALGTWVVVALVAAAVGATVAHRWASARLGGYTGDVLGAVEQLAEMATLVVAIAAARSPAAGLLSAHG